MARITCSISGLTFSAQHSPIVLTPEDGYFHPIFALPYRKLYGLFSKHCKGQLSAEDSYLLFLAYLHQTDSIVWKSPADCDPRSLETTRLIDANLENLIRVIEQTAIIQVPSFTQPKFVVDSSTNNLRNIPNWIAAWEDNIISFHDGYRAQRHQESLQKLENKLSYYIKSGLPPEKYAFAVANWAAKIADFPPHKEEDWKKIIRSCYNSNRMFSTPIAQLKEIKAYCEENIPVGSIHFHSLMETLKEGISRHVDFLGMGSLSGDFAILSTDSTKNDEELLAMAAKAPTEEPSPEDYSSKVEFLRAKFRYRIARKLARDTDTSALQKEKDTKND